VALEQRAVVVGLGEQQTLEDKRTEVAHCQRVRSETGGIGQLVVEHAENGLPHVTRRPRQVHGELEPQRGPEALPDHSLELRLEVQARHHQAQLDAVRRP
jgi:hypothetical protein